MNLIETKDHIIKKLPNLTPEEKFTVMQYFNKHPNLESKIDWNKGANLTMDDFTPVLNAVSIVSKKRAIDHTVQGLNEGTDYIVAYNQDSIVGFSPLSWEASKALASGKVGGSKTEGAWCVAYEQSDQYWNQYVGDEHSSFLYFIDYNPKSQWGKVAVRIYNKKRYEIWDNEDHRIFQTETNSSYIPKEYPQFLANEAIMLPIIANALQLISEAGGNQAEQQVNYEIRVSYYAEESKNFDDALEVSVSYEQNSYTNDGGDYDSTNKGTYACFDLVKIGADHPITEDTQFIYDLNFNALNGDGLYLNYRDDRTFSDAESEASNTIEGEMNQDTDMWDMNRELEKFLKNADIQYLISHNAVELDSDTTDLLSDYIDIKGTYDRSMNKNVGGCETIEDRDHAGTKYFIYYVPDYNHSHQKDWASTPMQRQHDHQLDLPFGL